MPVPTQGKRKRGADDDGVGAAAASTPPQKSAGDGSKRKAASTSAGSQPPKDAFGLVAALQTTSPDALRATLSSLRQQTAPGAYNELIAANDARLLLAADFVKLGGLGKGSAEKDNVVTPAGVSRDKVGILEAWDMAEKQSLPTLLPLNLFALSQLLRLLSAHQPFHELGDYIIDSLLPTSLAGMQLSKNVYWSRLQMYLGNAGASGGSSRGKSASGSQAASTGSEVLTLATIRLLLEMSSFASAKHARRIIDAMSWGLKTLPRLLNMRRRQSKKSKSTTSASSAPVTLDRPDVRTLWILLLLSFLRGTTATRLAALGLGRDFLPAIFKGLRQDPPDVVAYVLDALYTGLAGDAAAQKLPRAKVVGLLNEWTCKTLAELYEREEKVGRLFDEAGTPLTVADVVHQFLSKLCTHRGKGVCYEDNGWYGRVRVLLGDGDEDLGDADADALAALQDMADETSTVAGRGTAPVVYNKVLLGLLKSLPPARSVKQAELALRILKACPELLGPYLSSSAAVGVGSTSSLDPRPASSAWFCTASFLSRVLALPLPEFKVANKSGKGSFWPSVPPPLSSTVPALLPPALTNQVMTKGITHPDRLTRFASLSLLCSLLDRLCRFKAVCQQAARELGEGRDAVDEGRGTEAQRIGTLEEAGRAADEEEVERLVVGRSAHAGQWSRLWSDVEAEARRQLPDVLILVEQMQQAGEANGSAETPNGQQSGGQEDQAAPTNETKQSLLVTQAALRAVWLFQTALPDAIAAAGRLDLGRLLTKDFMSPDSAAERAEGRAAKASNDEVDDDDEEETSTSRLRLVCQLHTLRIVLSSLRSSATGGSLDLLSRGIASASSRSYLCLLMTVYITSPHPLIRHTSRAIVEEALKGSVLFQHEPQEWEAWVQALPVRYTDRNASPQDDDGDEEMQEPARPSDAGETLSEEQANALVFLDECMQRCLKTPHKYIEAARSARSGEAATSAEGAGAVAASWNPLTDSAETTQTDLCASPWLLTITEQLTIRLRKSLIDAPATAGEARGNAERGAIIAYLGRLMPLLVGSGRPVAPLLGLVDEIAKAQQEAEAQDDPTRDGISFMVDCLRARLLSVAGQGSESTTAKAASKSQAGAGIEENLTPGGAISRLRTAQRPLDDKALRTICSIAVRSHAEGNALAACLIAELHPTLESAGGFSGILEVSPALALQQQGQKASVDDQAETLSAAFAATSLVELKLCLTQALSLAMRGSEKDSSLDDELAIDTIVAALSQRSRLPGIVPFVLHHPSLVTIVERSQASAKDALRLVRALAGAAGSGADAGEGLLEPLLSLGVSMLQRSKTLAEKERAVQLLLPLLAHASTGRLEELGQHFLSLASASGSSSSKQSSAAKAQSRLINSALAALHRCLALTKSSALLAGITGSVPALISKVGGAQDDDETVDKVLSISYACLAAGEATLGGARPSKATNKGIWEALRSSKLGHHQGIDAVVAQLVRILPSLALEVLEHYGNDVKQLAVVPHAAVLAMQLFVAGSKQLPRPLDQQLASAAAALVFSSQAVEGAAFARICELLQDIEATNVSKALLKATPSKPQESFKPHVHRLAAVLLAERDTDADSCSSAQSIVDQGLLWAVRRFAEDATDDVDVAAAIDSLRSLIVGSSSHGVRPKPHLAEPVIEAAIKNRFAEPRPMLLVEALIRFSDLKTTTVANNLGRVLAHPQWSSMIDVASNEARQTLVRIVASAIEKDPKSFCRPNYVAPLLQLYGATLGLTDRRLFAVLRTFERHTPGSILGTASLWAPRGSGAPSSSSLDAVTSLEPQMALATCTSFPRSRSFFSTDSGLAEAVAPSSASGMYDPLFVLALLSAALADASPITGLQWLGVLRSNALGISVCALSSRCPEVRGQAFLILSKAYASVQQARFSEREHLVLILDSLRDCLPPVDRDGEGRWRWETLPPLPVTTTLFITHCLRALAAPSSFTFPLFTRYLLQRPTFDATDVPLLYNLLHSSSDEQHRQERTWMLRFLRDVVRSGGREEWRILKRRHVWELLASLYEACLDDEEGEEGAGPKGRTGAPGAGSSPSSSSEVTRAAIEEFLLASLSASSSIAFDLCHRRGLLGWCQQQLDLERPSSPGSTSSSNGRPRLFWALAIDSITEHVDLERLDRQSSGLSTAQIIDVVISLTSSSSLGQTAKEATAEAVKRLAACCSALARIAALLVSVGVDGSVEEGAKTERRAQDEVWIPSLVKALHQALRSAKSLAQRLDVVGVVAAQLDGAEGEDSTARTSNTDRALRAAAEELMNCASAVWSRTPVGGRRREAVGGGIQALMRDTLSFAVQRGSAEAHATLLELQAKS